MVIGSCHGQNCYLFIDSGSSVNLVSSSFVRRIDAEKEVLPCSMQLASFTQNSIPVRGEISLNVVIAGAEYNSRYIVTDLLDTEFLIGDPFLRMSGAAVDYRENRLRLGNGSSTPFKEKPKNVTRAMKVRCNRVTTIPPNTMQFIEGRLPATKEDHQGLIEPYFNTMAKCGVLFANAVVHSNRRIVPIQCINATDEPVTVYKNKMIAFLKPVYEHEFVQGVRLVREGQVLSSPADSTDNWRNDCGTVNEEQEVSEKWTQEDLFGRLKLDQLQVKMSEDDKSRLKEIIWKNRKCFSVDDYDIGCCNMYEAEIKLKEGATPVWTPPIPTPYKLRDEMDKQIDEIVKSGVAKPLDGPSSFNSPIFLVKKPSHSQGSNNPSRSQQKVSWRLVADLRNVNQVCMDEMFPLTNLNHVFDTIGSDSIFSSFDLSKSFWQVPYTEDSKNIMSFLHRSRTYCFQRTVMGFKNSSVSFTKMMNKLLATVPIEQLIFFIDDLFLSSKNVGTHLDRLAVLLERLSSAGLTLKPEKCELLSNTVTFVGVSISSDGIKITEDRVEDLLALPEPNTVKRVQKVLGAFNYVRKWIPSYAEVAKPLHKLTVKGTKFYWSSECQEAFDKLKRLVADSTTLCIPDTEDPFKSYWVQIDASKHGYGATLSQELERNGTRERRIVAFFSKAVPPYKREQGQTKLEFDSMVLALKQWDIYLRNTSFKVITDCKSLLSSSDSLFAKSDPALIRKCQELANYNFTIEHVEGKNNTLCDFLSRFPFHRKLVDQAVQVNSSCGEFDEDWGDHQVRVETKEIAVDTEDLDCEVQPVRIVVERKDCAVQIEHELETVPGMENDVKREMIVESDYVQSEEPCISGDYISGGQSCDNEIEISEVAASSVDSLETESKADQPITELQMLFDGEHDGEIKIISAKGETEKECFCEIPEMERSYDQQKCSKHVTFAITEAGADIQTLPDLNRLKEEQDSDPILKIVKQWVINGEREKIHVNRTPDVLVSYWKQFNLLKIEDGLLKRKWIMKKEEECRHLIVIPESCEVEILQLFHDNITNCHPGVQISVARCRQYFYWPKMEEEFKLYIQACMRCNEMKQPQKYLKAPLKHLFFHCFNDALIADHVIPEVEGRTPRGNRYILTLTDAWSNYVVAVAVKSQTAKENIAAIMKHWVLKYGISRELIVDNHPGFTANFFKAVWEYFGCKKTHGTSYKASSTARAEKSNKRINQALRAVIPVGKERDWDLYLDKVVFALNCLKNRRTGFSAHKMVYGREANIPLSLIVEDESSHQPVKASEASKDAYKLHQEMKNIIRKVRRNAEVDFLYAQRYHDRNILGPYFKEGDYCYVLVQCPKHKFAPRFRGPFKVTRVINDHLYVVQITPSQEKVVNISKMKHYNLNKYSKQKIELLEHDRKLKKALLNAEGRNKRPAHKQRDCSSDEEDVIELESIPRYTGVTPAVTLTGLSPYSPEFIPLNERGVTSPQNTQSQESFRKGRFAKTPVTEPIITPVIEPFSPVIVPITSVGDPETPAIEPITPVGCPETHENEPVTPVSETITPVSERVTPIRNQVTFASSPESAKVTPQLRTPAGVIPGSLSPVKIDFRSARSKVRLADSEVIERTNYPENKNRRIKGNSEIEESNSEDITSNPPKDQPEIVPDSPRTSRPGLRPRSILKKPNFFTYLIKKIKGKREKSELQRKGLKRLESSV